MVGTWKFKNYHVFSNEISLHEADKIHLQIDGTYTELDNGEVNAENEQTRIILTWDCDENRSYIKFEYIRPAEGLEKLNKNFKIVDDVTYHQFKFQAIFPLLDDSPIGTQATRFYNNLWGI